MRTHTIGKNSAFLAECVRREHCFVLDIYTYLRSFLCFVQVKHDGLRMYIRSVYPTLLGSRAASTCRQNYRSRLMAFSRSSLLNPPGASELSEPAKKSTVFNSKQGCIKTEKMRVFLLISVLFFVPLNLINTLITRA